MLSMMNVGRWPAILLREDEHLLQLASGLHSQVEAQQETFSQIKGVHIQSVIRHHNHHIYRYMFHHVSTHTSTDVCLHWSPLPLKVVASADGLGLAIKDSIMEAAKAGRIAEECREAQGERPLVDEGWDLKDPVFSRQFGRYLFPFRFEFLVAMMQCSPLVSDDSPLSTSICISLFLPQPIIYIYICFFKQSASESPKNRFIFRGFEEDCFGSKKVKVKASTTGISEYGR